MLKGVRNQALGQQGEEAAAAFLKQQGYTILERNFKSRGGEVDIVARDRQGSIAFVEVKTRRNLAYGVPQLAVTSRKQFQISKAALTWLAKNRLQNSPARFDVIAVLLLHDAEPAIEHIPNAFDLAW